MRIVEDNEHRLLIIARPWLAWLIAWPASLAGVISVVWPGIVDQRSAAWVLLGIGAATLFGTDFSVRVEADKDKKMLSIHKRWLWRREQFRVRFRDVLAVNREVDFGVSRGTVVRMSHRRAVVLRHASLFCDHNKIVAALGAAISPPVGT